MAFKLGSSEIMRILYSWSMHENAWKSVPSLSSALSQSSLIFRLALLCFFHFIFLRFPISNGPALSNLFSDENTDCKYTINIVMFLFLNWTVIQSLPLLFQASLSIRLYCFQRPGFILYFSERSTDYECKINTRMPFLNQSVFRLSFVSNSFYYPQIAHIYFISFVPKTKIPITNSYFHSPPIAYVAFFSEDFGILKRIFINSELLCLTYRGISSSSKFVIHLSFLDGR